MATKIIISPNKYIQGPGELEKLESYTRDIGDKPLIIGSTSGLKRIKDKLESSFEAANADYFVQDFNGECCKSEVERLKLIGQENECDMVIGIGGGKTLDTAKAVAFYMRKPVVIVPTIASTDAPCSALSVLYTEEGIFSEYLLLPTNPSIVLMDTDIIAAAPTRLLVAGMGDALATYFEARASLRSNSTTMAGAMATEAATAIAALCYKTLLSDGLKAKLAAESKVSNASLEKIVEANTLLSGIGFESGGLSAAHAIHNGFTVLEECHDFYHGEKVAFGTLVQLTLENAPLEEIKELIQFCKSVGLPTTLKDLNADQVSTEQLKAVAKASTVEGETIHNMPFNVTADDVYAAILSADKLGSLY